MAFSFVGEVAIVTGAGSRIKGKETPLKCLENLLTTYIVR